MILDKDLAGGYLPFAITLVSEKLFFMFNGSVAEGKALAYGHRHTGNSLGCATAKASLEVCRNEDVLEALKPKIRYLTSALGRVQKLPGVKEVRRCGFIAGIETVSPKMAAAVCIEARRHGLLTRPIWSVVVLMRPLCITTAQVDTAMEALCASISEVTGRSNTPEKKDAKEVTA
jgi:adenosylmethionine-8-amino-7-oxononanoate aminotransferase